MGGGTILILLLSLFTNVNQHTAQATNLVYFIPTAISSILIGMKNKNVQWKLSIPIIISGCIGTILGVIISIKIDVKLLRKLFGIFLIIIAIYEIYCFYKMYIKEKNRHNSNNKKINKGGNK